MAKYEVVEGGERVAGGKASNISLRSLPLLSLHPATFHQDIFGNITLATIVHVYITISQALSPLLIITYTSYCASPIETPKMSVFTEANRKAFEYA